MGMFDLCKSDRGDAQVDAIVRMLRPLFAAHWRRLVERAVEEARQRVLAFQDELPTGDVDALVRAGDRRDKALQDLVVAFLAALGFILQVPPSSSVTAAVRESAGLLLARGAAIGGVPLTVTAFGADLSSAAAEDAFLILRLEAEAALKAARPLIEAVLTRADLRRPAPGALEQVASGTGIEGWLDELRTALGAGTERWLDPSMDLWAYRWANVATFVSAMAEGFVALQAFNNPPTGPDSKTTPFCSWVHLKLIPFGRMERSVQGYLTALKTGDRNLIEGAWPLLSAKLVTEGSEKQFEKAFVDVGLPPYHFNCRTVTRPVRIG